MPQRRQQKETQELIANLKINDEVVTNGGIIGRIKEVRDTSFIIQSADKSFIEIARTAVVGKRAEKQWVKNSRFGIKDFNSLFWILNPEFLYTEK